MCENGSMPFSPEQQFKVIETLGQKLRTNCPGCDQRRRQLMPDLVLFQIHQQPATLQGLAWGNRSTMPPPGSYFVSPTLPCVVVICENCGFTEFYNVHRLGIAGVLNVPDPGVPLG
jgi:hypothetical protein